MWRSLITRAWRKARGGARTQPARPPPKPSRFAAALPFLHREADSIVAQIGAADGGARLREVARLLTYLGQPEKAAAITGRLLDGEPDVALLHEHYGHLMSMDVPESEMLAAGRAFHDANKAALGLPREGLPRPPLRGGDRLRIAYHYGLLAKPSYSAWLVPILRHHARFRFDVVLLSRNPFEERAQAWFDADDIPFVDFSATPPAEQARRIREMEIDVLFDLEGAAHREICEVFYRRPAPIQISWFNILFSTGCDCFDFLMGNETIHPPECDRRYPEGILRLPDGRLSYEPLVELPEPTPLPAAREGIFTFGSLAKMRKVTGATLDLWGRVLRAVPASRFLFGNDALVDPDVQEYVWRELELRGVERSRVQLEKIKGYPGYLRGYERIDLGLGTYPLSGGTTVAEAALQGVPYLSICGEHVFSRVARSHYRATGLQHFCFDREDELVAEATRLADSREELGALRSRLRDDLLNRGKEDAAVFTQALEAELERILAQRSTQT